MPWVHICFLVILSILEFGHYTYHFQVCANLKYFYNDLVSSLLNHLKHFFGLCYDGFSKYEDPTLGYFHSLLDIKNFTLPMEWSINLKGERGWGGKMNNVELLDLEESTIMSFMFINGRSLMVKCCQLQNKTLRIWCKRWSKNLKEPSPLSKSCNVFFENMSYDGFKINSYTILGAFKKRCK
jgi:hypothetical protein